MARHIRDNQVRDLADPIDPPGEQSVEVGGAWRSALRLQRLDRTAADEIHRLDGASRLFRENHVEPSHLAHGVVDDGGAKGYQLVHRRTDDEDQKHHSDGLQRPTDRANAVQAPSWFSLCALFPCHSGFRNAGDTGLKAVTLAYRECHERQGFAIAAPACPGKPVGDPRKIR